MRKKRKIKNEKWKVKNNEKRKKDKWLQLKKMYDNTIKRREGEKAFFNAYVPIQMHECVCECIV